MGLILVENSMNVAVIYTIITYTSFFRVVCEFWTFGLWYRPTCPMMHRYNRAIMDTERTVVYT